MCYLKKRAREGSTWAGLAALMYGAGEIFKIKEAGEIVQAIGAAGQAAQTGDFVTAGMVGFFGLIAAFIRDRD